VAMTWASSLPLCGGLLLLGVLAHQALAAARASGRRAETEVARAA